MKAVTACRSHGWQSRAHQRVFFICLSCLSLYLSYALILSASPFLKSTFETVYSVALFFLFAAGLSGILLAVCRIFALRRWKMKAFQGGKWRLRFAAVCFGVCFVLLMITHLSCWPGLHSVDTEWQWEQAHGGGYNDWHPVFHTLLIQFLTLIADQYAWVILVQILAFALAYAYFLTVVRACGVPPILLLGIAALTCLTPTVSYTLCYAWKDNAMTIGALLLSGYSLQIFRSDGAWLKKKTAPAWIALAAAFTTLVRHNGFMMTFPLLMVLLACFWDQRRRVLAILLTVCALVGIVRGPVYAFLQVESHDQPLEESIGVPMTMLCNVKALAPEKLDGETDAFLSAVASEEVWAEYQPDSYNSIKFRMESLADHGLTMDGLLRLLGRSVQNAPRECFDAFNGLTDLVWGLGAGNESTFLKASRTAYEEGNQSPLGRLCAKLIWHVHFFLDGFLPARWLMGSIGVSFALLLIGTLLALYERGNRALLLAVPALVYNLGTMLLLCGNDSRFFHWSLVTALPMALALLVRRTKGEECEKISKENAS